MLGSAASDLHEWPEGRVSLAFYKTIGPQALRERKGTAGYLFVRSGRLAFSTILVTVFTRETQPPLVGLRRSDVRLTVAERGMPHCGLLLLLWDGDQISSSPMSASCSGRGCWTKYVHDNRAVGPSLFPVRCSDRSRRGLKGRVFRRQ